MEVKLGVTYSPKELVVEIDDSSDSVVRAVDQVITGDARMLWLVDAKGRRIGVPTDKLAYIEIGEDNPSKRVGFASL
ncbi:MAG TPA: DUF3107 domain-containing protein [Actinomycetota bacterium]